MSPDLLLGAALVAAAESHLWERLHPFLITQAVLLQLTTLYLFLFPSAGIGRLEEGMKESRFGHSTTINELLT